MKNILLTGSSGFVGGSFWARYKNEFNITPVSLREKQVSEVSFNSIDCIVHCAALVHQMKGAPEQSYFRVNFDLTKQLADEAKKAGVKHFIFISTAHVFGDSGSLYDHTVALNESSLCSPKDSYGKSKLAAENYLLSLQDADFIVSIIRPPMIYGKGAKGNIQNLAKLVRLLPVLPFRFSENKRSIVFIGNLCQFIRLCAEKTVGGILLPQDSQPVSLYQLTSLLAEALKAKTLLIKTPGFALKLLFILAPKVSVRLFGSLAFDSSLSNQKLGYKAQFSTAAGLKEMFTNNA